MRFLTRKSDMVDAARALPGRDTPLLPPTKHEVLGTPLQPPFPEGFETAVFGLGCFWGAERVFWQAPGVYTTAVGYAGGFTSNPTYEEVCSAQTGHTEAVLVVFDPARTTYDALLKLFWEGHDPTQGMRQGNDVGTQYRSAIYWTSDAQRDAALSSRETYQETLRESGYGEITTEIAELPRGGESGHGAAGGGPPGAIDGFFYAEDYHQQYLAKNPFGYCGLGGTGVSCPIGLGAKPAAQA
ncbi:MAG TPA: peptide-methionine (S)-S-oxide reductase MsrA [Conexibacter sp.]|nr:peptide-methionine (S)-S-oxide reductase MsrA [Conexibacter sp.]